MLGASGTVAERKAMVRMRLVELRQTLRTTCNWLHAWGYPQAAVHEYRASPLQPLGAITGTWKAQLRVLDAHGFRLCRRVTVWGERFGGNPSDVLRVDLLRLPTRWKFVEFE